MKAKSYCAIRQASDSLCVMNSFSNAYKSLNTYHSIVEVHPRVNELQ